MKKESFKVEKGAIDKGERDSMLSIWEKHKEIAPEIKKKQALSIEEIVSEFGIAPEELEERFTQEIQEYAKTFENQGYSNEEESYRVINILYSLYLQRDKAEKNEQYSWLSNLGTFDSFADTFLKGVPRGVASHVRRWISDFIKVRINPYRMVGINVYSDGYKMWEDIYASEGDWSLIPRSSEHGRRFEFVEKSIIKEVIKLIKDGYSAPDFNHGTGSAALDGISRHKAILSARESRNRDEPVKTGEFATYIDREEGWSVSGGELGLGSVYASRGNPFITGYQTVNWFDEYPISFGINQKKQADFLRTTDFRYDKYGEDEGLVHDYGSEGILIGDQVTIDAVETVYCLQVNTEEVQKWVQDNCPQATIVSLEAIETLRSHERTMNSIALQEGISPEESWELLLK